MRHIILLYQIYGIKILKEKRNQLNQGIDFTGSYLENGENVRKHHFFEKYGIRN